jgi:acyl-CoA synthetase (AMP-forming)/AMP-acid ligase II
MTNAIPERAHPSVHARLTPAMPAVVVAETGESMDFATLDAKSNQISHVLRERGATVGSGVAVLMENQADFFAVAWAAQRSGLFLTAISTKLTADEAGCILDDCGAGTLFVSPEHAVRGAELKSDRPGMTLLVAGPGLDADLARYPSTPIADEAPGADMLYSSGTTGRPKGVRGALPQGAIDQPTPLIQIAASHYGIDPETIYLSAGPLYHAAPLRWSMAVQALGGTVVVLRKFDPEVALAAIAKWRINASQWVPTHFVRMLKLPDEVRQSFDVSSMRLAIHAAAPCPADVKRAMMEWWGPVLHEYYAGTENFGFTIIGPQEWLSKPGSVGRAIAGSIHICGPDGEPLPIGETGDVFFDSDAPLAEYHGDPSKTRESRNQHGWATYGDIGHVDEEGFLFLTDRRNFTIISGGVNIYPREIEDVLIAHPEVRDVAVIGLPDTEMGERVLAVVEPMNWAGADDRLRQDLTAFARARLSGVKIPRQIDFTRELPRQPTGKLFKRLIRDTYLRQKP